MEEQHSFEMTDDELNALLDRWQAPVAPASLRKPVFPEKSHTAWRRFWAASIHVPVPAVAFIVLALLVWAALRSTTVEPPVNASRSTFGNLMPVRELKVRILERSHANN